MTVIITLLCLAMTVIVPVLVVIAIMIMAVLGGAVEAQRKIDIEKEKLLAMKQRRELDEARIAEANNKAVLTSLKIDQERRKMGLDSEPFEPKDYKF